jgi:hypothetical protein
MSKTRLEERQREMAERVRLKRKLKQADPNPKSKRWITDHFTEVMERLIDDLGLDVPRREHKQPTA